MVVKTLDVLLANIVNEFRHPAFNQYSWKSKQTQYTTLDLLHPWLIWFFISFSIPITWESRGFIYVSTRVNTYHPQFTYNLSCGDIVLMGIPLVSGFDILMNAKQQNVMGLINNSNLQSDISFLKHIKPYRCHNFHSNCGHHLMTHASSKPHA